MKDNELERVYGGNRKSQKAALLFKVKTSENSDQVCITMVIDKKDYDAFRNKADYLKTTTYNLLKETIKRSARLIRKNQPKSDTAV